jgi:hypothetical protein
MTMIIAVFVTLLSMIGYHQTPVNGWLSPKMGQSSCYSPPPADSSSLAGKGGGLESDSTGLREEDGPFPHSHPLPPPFTSLPSPPLSLGHLR